MAAGACGSTAGRCGRRRAATLAVPTRSAGRGRSPTNGAAVEEDVDPRAMPLTGLANAAIDRVAPDRAGVRRRAGALCRGRPRLLPRRGAAATLVDAAGGSWDALLAWARRRYDVDFATTTGLIHVPQPPATVERLAHAVAALDAFRLAGLSPLVTIGGSLVAALAVLEKAITPERSVGRGQRRRALAARAMGRGRRGGAGAGQPAPRLPGRRAVPGVARQLSAPVRPGRGRSEIEVRPGGRASAARRRRSPGPRRGIRPCRR